ncbi:hypothetical protein FNV43_RR00365 [Rhamnella rubrinervis]|uniref:non-specific serine/threonine protein kinase n=1 Tax=Rhamnella rubrinervis TaxID=2594499 RepID=A0A8K0MRY3_9ROSA|nr:hypothetical protein FNV43_RR00365 [Rhamnella rubrinervis]
MVDFLVLSELLYLVSGLGSMSSIAISYGEKGPAFCGLKSDGSHLVTCYGSNSAITYGTPAHFPFLGLTAGDGFVCGLLMDSNQPYCWGSSGKAEKPFFVDCWGYNMTKTYVFDGKIQSVSAGSEFNCGLFSQNRTVLCWGDETSSRVISLVPKEKRFQKIGAGGYHVCGILEGVDSRPFCWGKSLDLEEEISVAYSGHEGNVDLAPNEPLLSVVGGKFHACGIKSYDHEVICWGFVVKPSTPIPIALRFMRLLLGITSLVGFLLRDLYPCLLGSWIPYFSPFGCLTWIMQISTLFSRFYEFSNEKASCKSPQSRVCMPCSNGCPAEMYQKTECVLKSDRLCEYNCSICYSSECSLNCSSSSNVLIGKRDGRFWSLQLPVIIAEIAFALFLVIVVSLTAVMYVRYKLRECQCSIKSSKSKKSSNGINGSPFQRDGKIRPDLDDLKIRRAQMFTYEELERATNRFKEESLVGKGSFSDVFRGVLKDGTVVAVKRARMSRNMQNSKEFHTELDLLSRLNHAHLLNLLGYCEEGGERLLVYEFMAHGSLHQHLHGKNKALKEQLDWVRRVTIAVQAARELSTCMATLAHR